MIRKLLLVVAVLFLLAPSSASAYWPYMGYGNGWATAGTKPPNIARPRPISPSIRPVYYSPHITARHYGASPFAWPAGMQPITYVPQPRGVMIMNPNVNTHKAVSKPEVATTEVQPLEIANPFFVSHSR